MIRRCLRYGLCSLITSLLYAASIYAEQTDSQTTESSSYESILSIHEPDLEGQGHATLIDYGSVEILFDTGTGSDLVKYLQATEVIDGQIELVVVSHAHSDRYNGLKPILDVYEVMELWDPGFDTTAQRYQEYLSVLEKVKNVRRPLYKWHLSAVDSGHPRAFTLASCPNVRFTVLRSPMHFIKPDPVDYNNTSIVLLLEIEGLRILLPGDTQARKYGRLAAGEPQLVDLHRKFPGTIAANILIAPHGGSPSSSSQPFIDAVNPEFVLFSAMPRFRLPARQVLQRYDQIGRFLYSTDRTSGFGNDHIVLNVYPDKWIQPQFKKWDEDRQIVWEGSLQDGTPLTRSNLQEILDRNMRRLSASDPTESDDGVVDELKGADLTGADLTGANLSEMDLSKTILRGASLYGAQFRNTKLVRSDLSGANLVDAVVGHADFSGSKLVKARLPNDLRGVNFKCANLTLAVLVGADLSGANFAGAILDSARLRGSRMVEGNFEIQSMRNADLANAVFEPDPGFTIKVSDLVLAPYLATLSFEKSPHALIAMRELMKSAGDREAERQLTYSIERCKTLTSDFIDGWFRFLLFETTCQWGMAPNRPLKLLAVVIFLAGIGYFMILRFSRQSGLKLVVTRRRRDDPSKNRTVIRRVCPKEVERIALSRGSSPTRFRTESRIAITAIEFSLRSAFNLKFQWFEAGSWIRMIHRREYELEPFGWARTLSGLQSLLGVYLIAIWLLNYFGRPFG